MTQQTSPHRQPSASRATARWGVLLCLLAGLLLAASAHAAEDEILGAEQLPAEAPADDDPTALPPVAQAPQATPAPAREEPIEEIIVTARKREENLQEVPSSVIAFSRRGLEEQDITEFERLGQFAPNLQFMSLPAGRVTGAVQIGIRGRVQNDFLLTQSNSVGFYVDDVFFGKSVGFPLEFLDIERVEVLRGPQGTLYGKNTPAGAVKVITRKPTGEWGLEQDLRVGSFDYVQTRTTLNFPILGGEGMHADGHFGTLSGKVTFLRTARDDIYDNNKPPGTGIRFPTTAPAQSAFYADGNRITDGFLNQDRLGGQITLHWEIGDFSATYNFDIQDIKDETDAFHLDALTETTDDGFGGTQSVGFLRLINCSLLFDLTGACFGMDPTDPVTSALGPWVDPNRSNDVPQPGPTGGQVKIQGHSLVLDYDLEGLPALGDLTLKSITGFRSSRAKGIDLGTQGGPFLIFNASQVNGFRSFQQEVQAIGSTLDGHLDYVIGLFYGEESGHQGSGALGSMRLPSVAAYCEAAPAFCGGSIIDISVVSKMNVDHWSVAPFGQATYSLDLPNDQILSFTGGLRYTYEEREANVNNLSAALTARIPSSIAGDKSFDDVSPMGTVAWQVTDDKMLYALVSQGFRSGGFNGRGDSPLEFGPFKDEEVLNVEMGFKTSWLDGLLQLNATGFWQGWDKMQVTVFTPDAGGAAVTTVANAGKATFWGTEIEAVATPFEGALLNIGYGLVLAEFDEFFDTCPATVVDGQGGLCNPAPTVVLGPTDLSVDVKDHRFVSHHPKHSLTWGASYTFPPTDWGVLSVRLGGYYQTSMNPSLTRNDFIKTTPYHVLDARIQLAEVPLFRDSVMATFALWGKNITDEKYEANGIDLTTLGWAVQNYGERATFGGQILLEWGSLL